MLRKNKNLLVKSEKISIRGKIATRQSKERTKLIKT
jgi:hypothetical protein